MISRRRFLRTAATAAIGAGVLLTMNDLSGSSLLVRVPEELGISAASGGVLNDEASLIGVKVYYTLMTQYTNLTEEDFVLQFPATVKDLLDTCILRHPWMAPMADNMLILLNGMPSKVTASLKDGDTVQLIPFSASG